MLNRFRDPNRRVVMRDTYPRHSHGTWRIVLDDAETGKFVTSRLGFKTYDEAVKFARDYYNIEG